MNHLEEKLRQFIRSCVLAAGLLFLFCFIFAFTTGPFYLVHWLATSESSYRFKPAYIIVLGGVGMPSESALMRAYYAQAFANKYPQAMLIISQLSAGKKNSPDSEALQIGREVILHSIDSLRIHYISNAHNTREEAIQVMKRYPGIQLHPCILVSAPCHMKRAILCFRKAGFKYVGGEPAFNQFSDIDYRYTGNHLGGRAIPGQAIGENVQLRYQVWNHLKYQVDSYRELTALAWYKLKGWI